MLQVRTFKYKSFFSPKLTVLFEFYRSVRIGKILIQRDEETHQPKVTKKKL